MLDNQQNELFDYPEQAAAKTFSDYLKAGNKKGAIDHLRNLKKSEFIDQVISAGYSMISFKHGVSRCIKHVAQQIK